MNTPYPAELVIVQRRGRHGRPALLLLAVAAAVLAALVFPPKHPAPRHSATAAVVAHQPAARRQVARPAPAKAGVTVTVNGTGYACTVPVKPKPKG